MTEGPPDLSALPDADEEERLRAARWLRRHPDPAAVAPLKAALAREDVRWVRVALREAIEESECSAAAGSAAAEADDASAETETTEDITQAYADGRRDGLRQALHEITASLGLARAAAELELGEGNPVRAQLDRMRAVVGALRQLVSASDVSERCDFDLAQLLTDLCRSPPAPCPEGVVGCRGDSPFVISGDQDLLELALRPPLTNAIEAVLSVTPAPPRRSVMMSYGIEDTAFFIAIIDRGPGLVADPALLTTGVSTKEGHVGLGLKIACTAIESLGGSFAIADNHQGGATAILRWPRMS
jgi:signal transduction histidine kinase